MKCTEKTGNIVSVLEVSDDEELICITSNGVIIRVSMEEFLVLEEFLRVSE